MAVRLIESADGALVRLQLEGKTSAFDDLYRRFFPRLVRLLSRRVGDPAAAEDIAQEALLRVFTHLGAFDISRPMWPWLKAIATNLAADYLDQQGREALMLHRVREEEDSLDVDDLSRRIEQGPLLAKALSLVPKRQRVALTLRYLDDWDPVKIAAFLGLTKPAMEQLLFRARRKLRAEYQRVAGGAKGSLGLVFGPPFGRLRSRLRLLMTRLRRNDDAVQLGAAGISMSSGLVSILAGTIIAGILAAVLAAGGGESPPAAHPSRQANPGSVATSGTSARGTSAGPEKSRILSVRVSSSDLLPGAPPASAKVSSKANKRTIRVRGEADVAGHKVDVPIWYETDVECDYSAAQQAFCTAIDALPSDGD